jgi:predicted metal-dependent phosphoesterase TrpH
MTVLRADMHVHTCYSRSNDNIPLLGARDCYSRPEAVYAVAKARGMDLVAITDHDTIDGALALVERMPDARDIIVGEEVSCRMPDLDVQVHLGVYGMTESLHRDLQPLRRNVFDLVARLREASVFFALNHLLHFYESHLSFDTYLRLLEAVPALEVRNGTMVPAHNRLSEQMAAAWTPVHGGPRLAAVAGSDAHTLRRVGTTWTEAPGRDRDEFLSSVCSGLGRPGGRDGGALAVSGDAYGVIRGYVASLAGIEPPDHSGWRRAACLVFAIGSLPFQVLPFAITSKAKLRERRKVRALGSWMSASPGWDSSETSRRTVEALR